MAQVRKKKAAAPANEAGAANPRKKVAKAAPGTGLDPSREWSLDEVEPHLPPVPRDEVELLKEMLLGAHSQREFVAWGAAFRTEDIVSASPPFIVGCLAAVQKLGKAPPGLSLGYFPLLLEESRELHRMHTRFEHERTEVAATISGRRAQLKNANSRALDARRNLAQTLLRNVVPANSKHRAELESAAAGTDNPAGTVASVRIVVRIAGELRQDRKIARVLDSLQYGEDYLKEVSALADEVDELSKLAVGLKPPQLTSQTALDQQDGVVCALMRAIWVPLRDVQVKGAAVRLPPVGALERLFISRPTRVQAEEEPQPASGG